MQYNLTVKTKEQIKAEAEAKKLARAKKQKAKRMAILKDIICSIFVGTLTLILMSIFVFSLISYAFMCI